MPALNVYAAALVWRDQHCDVRERMGDGKVKLIFRQTRFAKFVFLDLMDGKGILQAPEQVTPGKEFQAAAGKVGQVFVVKGPGEKEFIFRSFVYLPDSGKAVFIRRPLAEEGHGLGMRSEG